MSVLAADAVEPARPFVLVDEGRQAVIVGNATVPSRKENGYYRGPAQPLAHYIAASTGHELQLVAEADYEPSLGPAIFMPGTKRCRERYGPVLANLDRDSYLVAVESDAVYLLGAASHSGDYAQFDFLERYLGIATYLPTEWGTIVPQHQRLLLAPALHVESPAFNSRAFSALNVYQRKQTGRLNYSGNTDIPWPIYRRDTFSHNLHSFITVAEFGETHPEYFPEINGKRVIVSAATAPGPCIANAEVIAIVIDKVRAWFDDPKHADADIISLGMTDGGWCECARCRATDGVDILGNPSRSHRYYTFLNPVAEAIAVSHPGKSIGVLAYAGADWPPRDLTVARNIVPYVCQTRGAWGNLAARREHLRQTFAWTARVNKIGVYEYLYGSGYLVPRIYHQQLADYLRAVRSQGNGGFYCEIYSNHGLDGPKAWVTQKLVWNPYQDPAELQTRWCRALFDEAAAPMDAYFQHLEAVNARNIDLTGQAGAPRKDITSKFYLLQDDKQFMIFTIADLDRAWALLREAEAATARDEIRQRIAYFSSSFKITDIMVRSFRGYLPAQQSFVAGRPAAEVLGALIDGDRAVPQDDPHLLLAEAEAEAPTKFLTSMQVDLATSTELNMQLVNGAAWNAVYAQLAAGEGARDRLLAAGREAILQLAPPGWQEDETAARRVNVLLAMAERIAVARRIEQPPKLDGSPDDPCWRFTGQQPWFNWKSGLPYAGRTELAFAHDGSFLYVAGRCHQDDLAQRRRAEGYGAAAWKFVSMELHLNPDARDAAPEEVPRYQVIPALGGGLWANQHDVTEYAISEGGGYWQFELKIDLGQLKMPVSRFPALRLNLVRNVLEHGHHGKTWFPSSNAHADPHARGWLLFE